MTKKRPSKTTQIRHAQAALRELGFDERQTNEMAALVLLALLDLRPAQAWDEAKAPLRGITPIIGFIADNYRIRYAPTRAKPSAMKR